MTETKLPKITISKLQFNSPYKFMFSRFSEGESANGQWWAWWMLDDRTNPATTEDGAPTGDGMEKPLFLRPDNTHQASLHEQLLGLNLVKGVNLTITREKFEDQPYRITAARSSSSGPPTEETTTPSKPPQYSAVTVASLSTLMEQCIRESFLIWDKIKQEDGLEYGVEQVQSVAQTLFHKSTDDRSVIPAFAPLILETEEKEKEGADDLPF